MLKKYNPKNILHIGGHYGEEGEEPQEEVEKYLLTKGFIKTEEYPLFDDPNAYDVYFKRI